MDTGAIIAIAVIAALILIALVVLVPRMRSKAEERKVQQHRQEAAEHHRVEADQKQQRAELAEAEAKKARAEAEMDAKKADLHERGMADHELGIDTPGRDNGHDREVVHETRETREQGFRDVSGGRAHEPVEERTERTEQGPSGRFTRTEQHDVIAEPERDRR